MANSRSISHETWTHAREVLVYYFSRRHGFEHAEDLAQDTLTAILSRDDFEFDREEDFQRVCLGFARFVSKAGHRSALRNGHSPLEVEVASPGHHALGARATESRILLDEVREIGSTQLREEDWQIILSGANLGGEPVEASRAENANKFRVNLHRARKKLVSALGWKGSKS